MDAVLIRDLPFRDASSLVSIWRAWPSWRMGRSALGVATGLGLAAAAGGVVGHLLFDVGARDPLTYAVIAQRR